MEKCRQVQLSDYRENQVRETSTRQRIYQRGFIRPGYLLKIYHT